MPPRSSRDLPGPLLRKDEARETRKAIIEDADKTGGRDRDLEHGDGGTLGLPMSEQLLASLNPGQRFDRAGATIVVVDTASGGAGPPAKADRVEVDKRRQVVKLFDKSNALLGFYPATVGSEEKPSPTGSLKVTEIHRNPTYRYNPDYRFKEVRSRKPFTIKPGPNNPVGTVWVNLSAEGYGVHGTPSPGKVSKAKSHGCVRLTNWDAERVAERIAKGTTVAFVDGAR